MPKPPLTVQNAEITTARVEIKTLTVSGKQVTLAVFRQLRDTQVVRDDGTLAGQPWGVVNYHPDRCDKNPAHLHVVWQRGTDLLRSAVEVRPTFDKFCPDEADSFLDSVVLQLASTGATRFFQGEPPIDQWGYAHDGVLIGEEQHLVVRAELSEKGTETARALGQFRRVAATQRDARDPASAAERLEQAKQHLDQAVRMLRQELGEHSTEEFFTSYRTAVDEENARRRRHRDIRASLAALPQLFIAV